ncbi:MAG: O-succinylhomoserine sulfhydrylase [Burkholderiales bacterium]|nr:O-succinylhomoserine sulfhydrylase [Burkholderiales bacterium]
MATKDNNEPKAAPALGKAAGKKRLPRKEFSPDVRLETLAVREGLPASQWGENSEALFLTSSFVHPDAATAAARFANEEESFVYSRFTNPTTMMFERRLAALEGTEAAIATSSGMSAILLMIMGLLKAGDHVVCSRSVFGATITLFDREFGKFGVQTTFVSQTDLNEWRDAIRPNTKLLFAETPSNPLTEVCDIRALAELAHANGALLAVDNCFCSPALQQPVKLGADLIIHSGTKYLDGQGRVLAGAICGSEDLVNGTFMPVMRGAGMSLSPFNAWVVLKGLETLSIRMAAQSANALQLATWLEAHPQVERVYYPGLKSHPQYALAMQQQNGSGGAVVSFVARGARGLATPEASRQAAFHVIDQTRLCSITANLGDTKTTITHPGTTSHGRLKEEQRQAAGVTQGLIRVSVGLEHIEDLKADLARGLDSLASIAQ